MSFESKVRSFFQVTLLSSIGLGLVLIVENDGRSPVSAATTSSFILVNAAAPAGLHFKQNNYATEMKYPFETLGGAVAALDYDNDGAVDLLFLNGSPSPEHVKTAAESFNHLYRNNRNGTFTDVTAKAGVENPRFGVGAACLLQCLVLAGDIAKIFRGKYE